MKDKKVVSLITIGSHSKSISHKNFVDILGQPLCYYNIQDVSAVKVIDQSYVITPYPTLQCPTDYRIEGLYKPICIPKDRFDADEPHHERIAEGVKFIENDFGDFDIIAILLGNSISLNQSKRLEDAINWFMVPENYAKWDSVMTVGNFAQFNTHRAHMLFDDNRACVVIPPIGTDSMYKEKCASTGWFYDGGFWLIKHGVVNSMDGTGQFPFMGRYVYGLKQESGTCMELDAPWQKPVLECIAKGCPKIMAGFGKDLIPWR